MTKPARPIRAGRPPMPRSMQAMRQAMEAVSLQRAWRIEVAEAFYNSEYLAWLRWREDVEAASRSGGWRCMDEILAWRIACIERGMGGLPAQLAQRLAAIDAAEDGVQ